MPCLSRFPSLELFPCRKLCLYFFDFLSTFLGLAFGVFGVEMGEPVPGLSVCLLSLAFSSQFLSALVTNNIIVGSDSVVSWYLPEV